MTPRQQANAFRLWRIAQAHDWDLTQTDLVRLSGMPRSSVSDLVRLNGWSNRLKSGYVQATLGRGGSISRLVDGMPSDENRLDLVELFSRQALPTSQQGDMF